MICYRDRSFCANQHECDTYDCYRRLTDYDKENAIRINLPICLMAFKDTCGKFSAKQNTGDDAMTD